MANDIGQGTYLVFSSILAGGVPTTANYRVNSVSIGGISRDVVDASHMLTTGGKEFLGSEYYDPGELTVEVHHDPAIKPWLQMTNVSTAQSLSMHWAAGGSATMLWSAFGYVTGFEATAPKDDMMTGTLTIKLSGSIT